MAILDEFEAQIVVNGVVAREFDNDEEVDDYQPSTVTKYIEVLSNAKFIFNYKISSDYEFQDEDSISIYVYLDGKFAGGNVINKTRITRGIDYVHEVKGHWTGMRDNRKYWEYHFADLETRDMNKDDDVSKMKAKYENLGTMRVEFWRTLDLGESTGNHERTYRDHGAIPEKALKGRPLAVATSLKPAAFTAHSNSKEVSRLDKEPLAKFVFKYRTRKALQSLLIIPGSESHVPIEDRPIEDLSPEEMRELLRQQRAQPQSRVKVEGTFAQRLKRERATTVSEPARPLKTSRTSEGQTIYHLDSDDEGEGETKAKESLPIDEEVEVVTLT